MRSRRRSRRESRWNSEVGEGKAGQRRRDNEPPSLASLAAALTNHRRDHKTVVEIFKDMDQAQLNLTCVLWFNFKVGV